MACVSGLWQCSWWAWFHLPRTLQGRNQLCAGQPSCPVLDPGQIHSHLLPIATAADMGEILALVPSDLRWKIRLLSPIDLKAFHKDFKDIYPLGLPFSGINRTPQYQLELSMDTQKFAETCINKALLICQWVSAGCILLSQLTHNHWLSKFHILEYHLSFLPASSFTSLFKENNKNQLL